MATKSIVGRFLIFGILVVAVGVIGQAAFIMLQGGKKVATASADVVSSPQSADGTDGSATNPVRVVYPGPNGDGSAQRPKLADAATASPLAAPSPETKAKLLQAMGGAPVPAQPASPQPSSSDMAADPATPPSEASVAAAAPSASPATDAAPSPSLPAASPTPAPAVAASQKDPAPSAPAGVVVASLGGGAPAADPSSAGGININTASVADLNRLGGGHIGQSIAKHRPYASIDELVKKRVLRHSVFDQIKGQIAAR